MRGGHRGDAADYTFMAADLGGHTFGNFALLQAGLPTLSGVDTAGPTPGGFVGFSVVFSTRP